MSKKFGRNYIVTIDPKDGQPPLKITMPLTIRFWIQRTALSSQNTLTLDIFNLSETNRTRLYQDNWIPGLDPTLTKETTPGRTIKVEMGYDTLYQVFNGTIQEASNAREGTNIVTRIEAWDNKFDIAATQTFQTLSANQTVGQVLGYLIGQFPNLKQGAIGSFPTVMPRPVALAGSTWDLIKKYSNNNVFIDNGKVYCLAPSEVVQGTPYEINSSTGLLETPRRMDNTLLVTMLLETGITMATQVKLESSIAKVYNSQNSLYKVIGIRHDGIISGAVNGRAITTLTLNAPNKFKGFSQVQGQ